MAHGLMRATVTCSSLGKTPFMQVCTTRASTSGVKVSRNAILAPRDYTLERSSRKIIGLHSRNLHSWAQQVSSLRYRNL